MELNNEDLATGEQIIEIINAETENFSELLGLVDLNPIKDFEGVNLDGVDLSGISMVKANLKGTSFYQANLRDSNLSYAILTDANLKKADLRGADLSFADLTGTNLSYADFRQANLIKADLRNSNIFETLFNESQIKECNLGNLNLDEAVIFKGIKSKGVYKPEFSGGMKGLIQNIAMALVDHPEYVSVAEVEGDRAMVLELKVAKEDLGKVIGKQGRTAQAMRTILNNASVKSGRRIVLEILE